MLAVRCAFAASVSRFTHDHEEIQGKALGMAVEILDPDGNNIEDTGMPGELVCTRPHPSMPVYFWADKNDEKYRNAYFNKFPGRCFLSIVFR